MPMNADIKEKWLKALRSGDYKQGRNWLANNDQFCCLGVLCEISPEITKGRSEASDIPGYTFPSGDFHTAMLNNEYMAGIGLDRRDALDLAAMNDSGQSFGDIAKHIEANY